MSLYLASIANVVAGRDTLHPFAIAGGSLMTSDKTVNVMFRLDNPKRAQVQRPSPRPPKLRPVPVAMRGGW